MQDSETKQGPAGWPNLKRRRVKQLCAAFNREDDPDARLRILEQLLGKPTDAHFEAPFFCDVGTNITIGRHCFANHNVVILDCAPVTIGDNVLIGPNTVISAAGHPLDPVQRNAGVFVEKPITIGNSVWIGANVTVMGGVTIGDNCTIGAGSVVTRDVPPNSLAAGSPCKVIRAIQPGGGDSPEARKD
ncbi:sugar O-acetyltransferase [Duganella ginsengisoli]|uniref:Acetyltransferase n=2 Tax=Pseudoduganella ginsengisoli TaxID=1462440 RepID=A0A6L6Q497_9BURK|nr:sugar O-acetyltransferase [Pseudoduganella ginsengisoli]